MARDTVTGPERRRSSCPICGSAAEQRWRPFCSRRCADRDLGKWVAGAYAIPSDEDVPEEISGEED